MGSPSAPPRGVIAYSREQRADRAGRFRRGASAGSAHRLFEVADSSLGYDRGTKLRIYAAAGIPVYVIVNIPERRIECYEEPVAGQGGYRRRTDYGAGEALVLRLAGDKTLPLAVDDVFGTVTR